MKCIVYCGLNDSKVRAKLYPLILSKNINEIFLIRDRPIILPKVTCITPTKLVSKFNFLKIMYKLICGIRLSYKNNINFVLGVYFLPHSILSLFVGKFSSIHTISSLIGTDINSDIPNSLFFQKIILSFDTVTVTGSNSKKVLEKYGVISNTIHIVPSVISTSFFSPRQETKKHDLLFIGNLTQNKRLDIIMSAVSNLDPKVNLTIVGDGPFKNVYKKLSLELNIENRCHFLGFKNDVRSYLSSSKVLVLASESEGLPQCVMEAMSSGIPSVVPDVGDMLDLVSHNHNSLLFIPKNVEDLTKKIQILLKDSKLYSKLSHNARRTAVDKVSLSSGLKRWNKIINFV